MYNYGYRDHTPLRSMECLDVSDVCKDDGLLALEARGKLIGHKSRTTFLEKTMTS